MSRLDDLLVSLRRLFGGSHPDERTAPTAATGTPMEPVVPEPAVAAEPEPEPVESEPQVDDVADEAAVIAPPEPAPPAAPVAEPEPTPVVEHAASPSGGVLLRLESERDGAPTFDVAQSGATIGRGPENTIRLVDLSVSRKHAKITYRQGAYWLSDLGSMGGTWVDGTKLAQPRRIATGQVIDIGVCRITVADAPDAQEEPVATGTARRRR